MQLSKPENPEQLPPGPTTSSNPSLEGTTQACDQFKLTIAPVDAEPILRVVVEGIRDLRTIQQEADMACFLTYGQHKVRTAASSNPTWNCQFDLPLLTPMGALNIVVKDQDVREGLVSYEDLGHVLIPIHKDLVNESDGWYDLCSMYDEVPSTGEIRLRLQLLNFTPQVVPSEHAQSTKPRAMSGRSRRGLKRESKSELMNEVNEMMMKLEDRDTRELAMNFLKDTITMLKPPLFAPFFKALVKNKVRCMELYDQWLNSYLGSQSHFNST